MARVMCKSFAMHRKMVILVGEPQQTKAMIADTQQQPRKLHEPVDFGEFDPVMNHDMEWPNIHRLKQVEAIPTNVLGMVTRVLSRRDPEYHTPEARAALMSEVERLIKAGVWDLIPILDKKPRNYFPTQHSLDYSPSWALRTGKRWSLESSREG